MRGKHNEAARTRKAIKKHLKKGRVLHKYRKLRVQCPECGGPHPAAQCDNMG